MKKFKEQRFISFALAVVINFGLLAGIPNVKFTVNAAGYGSGGKFLAPISALAAGSTPISDVNELMAIKNDLGGRYHLTQDIEIPTSMYWTPIGSETQPFKGTFDGQGYIIKNLKIGREERFAGLFAYASGAADIKNVGLEGAKISIIVNSDTYSGGSSGCVGGIVGYGAAGISNCLNIDGTITVQTRADRYGPYSVSYTGGIIGYSGGDVINCYNTSKVTASLSAYSVDGLSMGARLWAYVGGISGGISGEITAENCYNAGEIAVFSSAGGEPYSSASSQIWAGGICGSNEEGTINNCYNTAPIDASGSGNRTTNSVVGGIIGVSNGSVKNCYNTESISASSEFNVVGGISGNNCGSVNNCYNTGNIDGGNDDSKVGAICGSNDKTAANCYWNIDSRQVVNNIQRTADNKKGVGDDTYYVPSLSTADMKKQSSFNSSWDFTNIWGINSAINEGYPYLRAFYAEAPTPTYGISLTPAGDKTFSSAEVGYGAQTAHSVTVNNTGNQATGVLTVDLSGTNSGNFILSKTSISNIDMDGSDSFTVIPKTGLAAGTYTATVTVSGANVDSKSFGVSFTVTEAYVPVTNITGVPTTITAETALTLTGTVNPSNATNKTITWSVVSAGTTGATISDCMLNTTGAGEVTVKATIDNGTEFGHYTQDFKIKVNALTETTIKASSATVRAGSTITLQVIAANSPSLASLEFKLHYHESVMTLTSATLPDDSGFISVLPPNINSGILFSFTPKGVSTVNPNGVVINLTFKIAETADLGEYPITLSELYASDENRTEIIFNSISGVITVGDIMYGHFTGGSRVDGVDVLWIQRYIASGRSLDTMLQNFSTTIAAFDEAAARFTNGTRVDGVDVLWIQRYIASGRNAMTMLQNFPTTINFSHLGVTNPVVSQNTPIIMPKNIRTNDAQTDNSVTLTSSATSVSTGDIFTVTLSLNLDSNEDITAFEFYLNFDPDVLNLIDHEFPGVLHAPAVLGKFFTLSPKGTDPHQGNSDVVILTFEMLDDTKPSNIGITVDYAANQNNEEVDFTNPSPVSINSHDNYFINALLDILGEDANPYDNVIEGFKNVISVTAGKEVGDIISASGLNVTITKKNYINGSIYDVTESNNEKLGTGTIIEDGKGNKIVVVIENDLTGNGDTNIDDAQLFLESLVGNYELSEDQRLAVENYDNGDSAIKKLRAFLNSLKTQ